jgi:hypothetical protein
LRLLLSAMAIGVAVVALVIAQARVHARDVSPTAAPRAQQAGNEQLPAQPSGVYRSEIAEGAWTHSLAHGYLVVLVKCADACNALFDQFEYLYQHDLPPSAFGTVKMIVTPYSRPFQDPTKEAPITLLTWDHDLVLQQFDRDQIIAFYRTYIDQGPERVP